MASRASLPSKAHLISTYRSLLRSGLKAVQYSSPAKFAIQQKLRTAFEKPVIGSNASGNENGNGNIGLFNQSAIDNTKQFLDRAAASLGMEHKIVKNLCAVHVFQCRTRYVTKPFSSLWSPHWRINWSNEVPVVADFLYCTMIKKRERPKQKPDRDLTAAFYNEYYETIKLLNKSMNLELR